MGWTQVQWKGPILNNFIGITACNDNQCNIEFKIFHENKNKNHSLLVVTSKVKKNIANVLYTCHNHHHYYAPKNITLYPYELDMQLILTKVVLFFLNNIIFLVSINLY